MLKYPFFSAFIYLVAAMAVLYYYDSSHPSGLTIERAMSPVQNLADARKAILAKQFDKSIKELDDAIRDMRIIENNADSSAVKYIEQAIADLSMVEDEIRNDSIVEYDLNHAFFKALNSIAYANLTISEKNLDRGENYNAIRFMNVTFKEMVTSLNFATDERDKEQEKQVIEDIATILKRMKVSNFKFDYDSINSEVQEIIEK